MDYPSNENKYFKNTLILKNSKKKEPQAFDIYL